MKSICRLLITLTTVCFVSSAFAAETINVFCVCANSRGPGVNDTFSAVTLKNTTKDTYKKEITSQCRNSWNEMMLEEPDEIVAIQCRKVACPSAYFCE